MEPHVTYDVVSRAAAAVRQRIGLVPQVALILGSGLSHLAERIQDAARVPYTDVPHLVQSTVPRHAGQFVAGMLSGVPVVAMQGRVHFYEGYSAAEITLPVRVMGALGADILIVTNAAGGLDPDYVVGDVMIITDHIFLPGLAGANPLRGPNDDRLGVRFPDMTPAYDPRLVQLVRMVAHAEGIDLREGVYAMVAGPSYETQAEIRFLRAVGADAVGMSTAPEVVVARHSGMRVLGLSLITNVPGDFAGDTAPADAMHKQVLAVGEDAVPRLTRLVSGVLERIGATREA